MNDNASQRNWFPVIVGGLTIVLAIAFYARFRPGELTQWMKGAPSSPVAVTVSSVTEAEYQSAVKNIFAQYDATQDPQEAYNALIQLHVPASMQQFHIDCIIALGKLTTDAKHPEDALARFDALHAQYSWFTL